ncbi:hypothetical protein XM38_017870 [Halomicronema hongdechloris C2206]|uniref:Uncharacterized protein n=1 Tax=Halomicronema hongdechloris C2206 TaxID=1641165 RepID=A0A1Z3HKL0_9CYAN|nr:hypothetical protein XM38_017870 [Halomicronema hongdechloris C2206]
MKFERQLATEVFQGSTLITMLFLLLVLLVG